MAEVTETPEPQIGPSVGERGSVRLESPTDTTEQIDAVLNPVAPEDAPPDAVAEPSDAVTDSAEPAVADPAPTPDAPPSRMQKRIDALTARNYEYARRIAELEAVQAAPVASPVAEQAPPDTGQPLPDQFETTDAYIQAAARWQADQAIAANNSARDAEVQALQAKETAQDAQATWTEQISEVKAAHADYVEVLTAAQYEPMSPAFQGMLTAFPQGGEMLYQIAKQSGEATRLNALSDLDRMRALVELESTLTPTQPEVTARPTAPVATPTAAPLAPVVPVVASTETTPPGEMTYQQYKAYRARMSR